MRLVLTCSGPGETAGWLRPLLRALYTREPDCEVHAFFVPDDYATGNEAQYARALFPQLHVYDPKAYLKVAFGGTIDGMPSGAEIVLYLGGDVMHAARLHKRFGGAAAAYKFCTRGYAKAVLRAFAVDARNAEQLERNGIAAESIAVVGNLAVDSAIEEAADEAEAGAPRDGILIMPGSRPQEIAHLLPFFFTAALRIRRENASLPIAFAVSPFTQLHSVAQAIASGGSWEFFSQPGRLVGDDAAPALASIDGSASFPIVRNAASAARCAQLAVTIPGTKVIEMAVLGIPTIACTPLNAPHRAALNGPLTYLDRIPGIGAPLKRAVATRLSRRHRFHTQPNIDAGAAIVAELHGTLTPGRVARVALEALRDRVWLERSGGALKALYADQRGAAARMAAGLLECAQKTA